MSKKVSFKPMYNVFKWSGDEKPDKSWREDKINKQINNENTENIEETLIKVHEAEYNDKELCINRLSRRENVKNIKLNPYLDNSNYIDDINNQEMFLRPQYNSYQKNTNNNVIGQRDMIKQRHNNPYIKGDILKDLSDRKIDNVEYVKNQQNKYLKKE